MTRSVRQRRFPVHLVAVAVLLAGVLTALEASPQPATGDLAQLRGRALALVNEARERHGLAHLELGADLNEAAQAHARDMLERGYYAHVSPEGETVADRYRATGGSPWHLVAENIARCLGCELPPSTARVEALHEGWMKSPPHRENILRRGLDRFGFGIIVRQDQRLYAVQTFAGPGMPRGLQPGRGGTTALAQRSGRGGASSRQSRAGGSRRAAARAKAPLSVAGGDRDEDQHDGRSQPAELEELGSEDATQGGPAGSAGNGVEGRGGHVVAFG